MKHFVLKNGQEVVVTGMVGHDRFAVRRVMEDRSLHPAPIMVNMETFWTLVEE